jgi:hypothetical protein
VLVQADAHERLTLPTVALTAPRADWEQDPGLEPAYNPVLGRIQILAESGHTPMMVLHDYVSKRIMPLQERTRPTWLYTRVNDVTQLERHDGSALSKVGDDVDGGPPWGTAVGPTASTIEVGDDVDGGPPGGCCRRIRQCPPPRLKMSSMAGPIGGVVGGFGSIDHRGWRRRRW